LFRIVVLRPGRSWSKGPAANDDRSHRQSASFDTLTHVVMFGSSYVPQTLAMARKYD